jgi:Ca2+-binding RTX toxin-like protein
VYGYNGATNPNYTLTVDPGTATDDAYEDNDSKAITDARPIGGANSPNLGTLSAPRVLSALKLMDGRDMYRFEMSGTGTVADYVQIDFTHSQGDLVLDVFRSDGTTLVGHSDGTGNTERVSLNGQAPGTYYVKVWGAGGAYNANYTLTIDPAVPPPSDDAYEDNDSKAITDGRTAGAANSPNLGTITTRQIISGLKMLDGADWYKFSMNGAGTASDFVRAEFTQSQGDLDLVVYKSDGTTVVGSSTGSTSTEQVNLTGQPAGTYYAKVYGHNGATNPGYTLTIDPAAPTLSDDAYEDNDSKAITDARPAGGVNSPNLGTLTTTKTINTLAMSDSADWYKFQMNGLGYSTHYVRLNFTHSQGDLDLYVYKSDGVTLVGSSAGKTGTEQVGLNAQPAGTYYVKVMGASGAYNPNYSLLINPSAIGDDVYEDNDSRAITDGRPQGAVNSPNLGLLTAKRVISGLALADSNDYFKFRMDGAGTTADYVRIDYDYSQGNIDFALWRADGSLVRGSETANNYEEISLNGLPAGTYYVNAYRWSAINNPNYTLTIDPGTPPAANAQNYVVLFAGGFDAANNHSRYYNNIKGMYQKIAGFGLVPRNNIYVLYADGTGAAVDQNTGSGQINSDMSFAYQSTVLAGTKENLQSVMNTLSAKVDNDDNFLFYSFDHGGGTNNRPATTGEEQLTGWGNAIDDEVLAGWLRSINSGHSTYIFTQCFAGGMLDNLLPLRSNEFGAAATNHYEYSWGDGFAKAFLNGLSATSMTHAAYNSAYNNDPFSDKGSYPANGGTVANQIEHPWWAGANFRIFNPVGGSAPLPDEGRALETAFEAQGAAGQSPDLMEPNSPDAPTVTHLTSDPVSPIIVGQIVTLDATVTGDSVASVGFYEDLDAQGDADANELIGTDYDSAGGWTCQWDTKLHATGAVTLLAVAENAGKEVSAPRSLAVTLTDPPVNHAPTVHTFTSNPVSPVVVGQQVTLTATATDPDAGDSVTSVSFYEDLDGQGDADANEWIGTDSDIAGGWSYQWDTKLHATGAVTLLAVAEDVAKMPSAPRTLAMTFNAPIVNHAPTVNTLVSNPLSPIAASQLVTLTATASDPDGGLGDYIAAVAFYDDRDGQGDGDPEELIGSDSISTDGWSVIWDTALRAPGVVTLLGIAEDSFKELSAPGLLAVTLLHVPVNQPPVVTGFQSAPATWLTVGYPATLTVFANDPDTGDQISHVYFFEDLNRNGVGDMATPWLEQIGQDFDGGDGWSSAWDTTGHATGAVQLLAVAYDSTNTLSAARVLNVTLAAAPTASLTGGVLTITGGAGPDHLRVERDPGNTAMLRVSDVGNGNATLGTFADSEVGSISATLGEGNDSISVDASITDAATLRGGTGDDSLLGGGGFDSLYGDLGNDSLTGGGAADSLNGGSGTDRVIDAGNGNLTLTNVLLNANGNDVLSGMEQAHVTAGVGNDTINASAFSGSVTMLGGAGNDSLIGGAGNDWMTGDAGSDSFVGNGGADRVVESADASFALTDSQLTGVGTDSLSGIEQADLTGGGSANTLNASAFTRGPVSLGGGGGNDQLLGSNAGDLLNGGDGNDSMAGNGGNDSLTGGNGNDTFSGGAGSDRLVELGDASYTLTDTALTGGLGTDSLGADIESASLTGGAGNNSFTVTGWTKPVTLNGGDGNDTVIASGDRNFTLTNPLLTRVGSTSVSLSSIEGASLTGGAGNNALNSSAFTLGSVTLDGGAGNDSLIGGPGGDSLFGGDGNDRLDAGLGNDSMDGGAGNDTFLEKPGSTDSIRDTFGSDVLDFSTALRGVTVNLSLQGVLQAADSLGNGLILDGVFESVLGSSFNDALTGTSGANYLAGNNGNDTLRGLGANDTLNGGGGTDRVSESGSFNFVLANTSLTGASSDVDTLIGIEQAELRGTNNDDLLDPRAFTLGPVTLDGADGNDTLFGTGLGDSLVGGADDDSLLGGNGHDTLFGGAGNNHLDGAAGTDRVFESGDADFTFTPSIVNALGTDSLFNIEQGEALGLGGANTFDITQWTRPTTLNGGAGTDRVVAQNDANFTLTNVLLTRSTGGAFALANIEEASFSAAAGDNIMNAAAFTAGPVTLAGGDGNDSLMGGSGADSLEGGNGNDSLNGGLGDDIVSGGAGNDTYAERPGSDDVINDTGGGTADLLDFTTATAGVTFDLSLTSGQVQVVDALGNTVAINGGIERLTGSNFNDSLLGTVGPETINGSGGNDTLAGLAGNDSMAGGAGTDVLAESGGPNLTLTNTGLTGLGTDTLSAVEQASLTGTGAADTLNASGFTGPVTLVGGAGNDALMGGAGNDVLNGGADNDSIVGGGGVNRVVESNASFVLTDSQLTGLGTDVLANVQQAWLIGTGANDALNAAAFTKGPVTLDGGLGNDTLTGGTLNDSLLGGGGDDSLLGGLGNDSLTGGAGNDSLDGGGGTGDRLIETGDVDFTLGASLLTGLGSDALTGIEQVSLSGGDSDNRFNVSGWILPGVTLNGGAGTDRVLSANDANMTLTNVALSRTTGGSFSLLGIEEAELTGGAGNNILNAGAFTLGPVALIGDAGNDTLTGGSGNDQLRGDGENDRLTGGNGHDTMDGGMGNDALFGGNGDDYLLGYDGIDTLSGDAGNDTLIDWDVPPIPLSAGGTGVNIIITAKTDPLLLGPTGIMAVHFPWAPFS